MASHAVNRKQFVFEQFDNEMVLLNLEDGLYYNVSPSGVEILNLLEQGFSVELIIATLSDRYLNRDELPGLVEGFVEELVRECILIPRTEANGTDSLNTLHEVQQPKEATVFLRPVLSRFDDMQEILLLDPIHQVNEQGWPNR
jgi:hypothetical protein